MEPRLPIARSVASSRPRAAHFSIDCSPLGVRAASRREDAKAPAASSPSGRGAANVKGLAVAASSCSA
eukprot:7264261-Prymnesium_polylepis.1